MKPRKRPQDLHAFTNVIALNAMFTEDECRALALPIRMSFQLLLNGEAESLDVGRLIDHMNVALVRSWGTDFQPIAQRAVDALRRCYERYERLGQWGLDGPARADIEQGIALHEELVRLSTPRQMVEAVNTVERLKRKAA